jgi:hypothetical protein
MTVDIQTWILYNDFVSWSISVTYTKYKLIRLFSKGLFSRCDIFNMISRITEVQPWITFVSVLTHLGIKHNTETKAISSEVCDTRIKRPSLFLEKRTAGGILSGLLVLTSHLIHGAYNRCSWWSVSKLWPSFWCLKFCLFPGFSYWGFIPGGFGWIWDLFLPCGKCVHCCFSEICWSYSKLSFASCCTSGIYCLRSV